MFKILLKLWDTIHTDQMFQCKLTNFLRLFKWSVQNYLYKRLNKILHNIYIGYHKIYNQWFT